MKKSEFKTKWYYRLLKIIYHFILILGIFGLIGIAIDSLSRNEIDVFIGCIIGIPGVIIGLKLFKSLLNYIFWGKWDFTLIEDIRKISKLYNEDRYGVIGMSRIVFNTIFIIEILFLIIFSNYIIYNGDGTSALINMFVLYFIFVIIFSYISFKRFHNIGKSGWNTFALLIPIYQFYLLYLLIFKPGNLNPDEKLQKEKFWNIVVVLIFMLYGAISNQVTKIVNENYLKTSKIKNIKQGQNINLNKLGNINNENKKNISNKSIFKLLKKDDGNIYLYENGKEIDFLTTKAFYTEATYENRDIETTYIKYEILLDNGEYGIVKKISGNYEGHGEYLYYIKYSGNLNKLTQIGDRSWFYIKIRDLSSNKLTIYSPHNDGTETEELYYLK